MSTNCLAVWEKLPNSNLDFYIHHLQNKKDLMILSSAAIGNYSFICFDAFANFIAKGKNYFWNNEKITITDPFDFLKEKLHEYELAATDQIPPLQGGAVGYFGYEANHYLETLPQLDDNIQLPDIFLNFYATVLAFDHHQNEAWVIASGFPEKDEALRVQKARESIYEVIQKIAFGPANKSRDVSALSARDLSTIANCHCDCEQRVAGSNLVTLDVLKNTINKDTGLLRRYTPRNDGYNASFWEHYSKGFAKSKVNSNFSQANYIAAVEKTKEYILNGDIFQANLTQQFVSELTDEDNIPSLYYELMQINPAPFSAYIKIPNYGSIISASPERFIKLANKKVETCPIKGTQKRSPNKEEDQHLAQVLVNSEKDNAENTMIVDLMRNDLSRVCKANSVKVEELCALKTFANVHHLVSKITAELKENLTAIDLLKATFPPGSVTGAPKIRAMEIISELERTARGPYCGCIGYISFTGDMDTSVTIRSFYINKENIFFSAGGAVVLDSQAEKEYEESLLKAQALVKVLNLRA